eukprot:TRINITY_DN9435_c0_g1_i5.p1 TRINITY_DN9435_c0_g1~~TRINITY_DN9435_c0_g1_i5.p1  ORF type:complete len:292 (+),score=100.84 TRINITY_DN9435_c0_g1_i5:76-951(+)
MPPKRQAAPPRRANSAPVARAAHVSGGGAEIRGELWYAAAAGARRRCMTVTVDRARRRIGVEAAPAAGGKAYPRVVVLDAAFARLTPTSWFTHDVASTPRIGYVVGAKWYYFALELIRAEDDAPPQTLIFSTNNHSAYKQWEAFFKEDVPAADPLAVNLFERSTTHASSASEKEAEKEKEDRRKEAPSPSPSEEGRVAKKKKKKKDDAGAASSHPVCLRVSLPGAPHITKLLPIDASVSLAGLKACLAARFPSAASNPTLLFECEQRTLRLTDALLPHYLQLVPTPKLVVR